MLIMKKEPAQVDHYTYQEQKGTQHTPYLTTPGENLKIYCLS